MWKHNNRFNHHEYIPQIFGNITKQYIYLSFAWLERLCQFCLSSLVVSPCQNRSQCATTTRFFVATHLYAPRYCIHIDSDTCLGANRNETIVQPNNYAISVRLQSVIWESHVESYTFSE